MGHATAPYYANAIRQSLCYACNGSREFSALIWTTSRIFGMLPSISTSNLNVGFPYPLYLTLRRCAGRRALFDRFADGHPFPLHLLACAGRRALFNRFADGHPFPLHLLACAGRRTLFDRFADGHSHFINSGRYKPYKLYYGPSSWTTSLSAHDRNKWHIPLISTSPWTILEPNHAWATSSRLPLLCWIANPARTACS